MPTVSDAIEHLKKMEGALHVFQLDDEFSKRIYDEEHTVVSVTGVAVNNEAYDRVMERQHRVCVVYDDTVYTHIRRSAVIEMRSLDGELVGTEIPPDQIDQYKGRDDLIWISDNFVMFPEKAGCDVRFVVPPLVFYELDEVEGFADAIWASPSPSSSAMLKGSCGYGGRPKTSTLIVGFDIR